jgi:hypothetical protein
VDFDKAKAAATKIIGKEGKFPKLPGDLTKDKAAFSKANGDAVNARDQFEKDLLASKQAADRVIDTAQAFKDVFEGSDFGLDPKDKAQKKQIDDATKVLTDSLDEDLKKMQPTKAVLEQVFKVIASVKKSLDAAGA